MHYNAKGIVYVFLEWTFVLIELLVITLRIYSRTFLTRSVGSDDVFIVIAFALNVATVVYDLEGLFNGWSQHVGSITPGEYSLEQMWQYICYLEEYIVYFFIRASVMLFVLRLLPSYKKWQPRLVMLVFVINFLVTAYTCIMFGIACIPFKANWENVPNSKCLSKDVVAITNQINAALACVCDIATAVIPQFLLWNVQMKAKTKRQLNFLFSLGLITAALSIGRAATITAKALDEDTTWNMIPAYYFSAFECNLGLIFACGPALRQYWAYRSRTHTSLPTKRRQYPNEDFERMRYRINLRDIFWYRKAHMVNNKVFDAAPIFRSKFPPPGPASGDPQSSSQISNSVLDVWEKRLKKLFSAGHKTGRRSPSEATNFTPSEFSKMQEPHGASRPDELPWKKPHTNRRWSFFSPKSESSSNRATFLLSDRTAGASTTMTTQDEASWPSPSHDSELADELSNPKIERLEPIHGSRMV